MEPEIKTELQIAASEISLRVRDFFNQYSPLVRIIIYASLILAIPGYFITRYISHSYYERSLKAASVVAKPSFVNPKPVTIESVEVVSMQGNSGAYAVLQNENFDIAAESGEYVFRFYGQNNNLVKTETGTFYLLPNQKKYLVVGSINASEIVNRGELELKNIVWIKRFPQAIPSITLTVTPSAFGMENSPLGFVTAANIVNNSPFEVGKVRMVFLVKDVNNKVIAVSQREERNVGPATTRAFRQVWPGLEIEATKVEIIADTNLLDNANFKLSPR